MGPCGWILESLCDASVFLGKELRRKRGDDGGGTRVRVLSLGAHAGME